MKKLITLFFYIFNLILYYISLIIPKDKKIWIFGSWFGVKYGDNSRYLFEYINKYHPTIRPIWLTDSEPIIEELESQGYEVYKRYSLRAILIGLQAKYSIFVQTNLSDCMLFLNNPRTHNIQLWHGIPLKKIGFDDTVSIVKYNKSNLKEKIFPFLKVKYSLLIASSNEDKTNFSTAFNNQYHSIAITGYPRNDILLNQKVSNFFTITYLPTFRGSMESEIDLFSDYKFDADKWHKILNKLKVTLNIKMHPVNKPNDLILSQLSHYNNINFLDEIDGAKILEKTDILITDYSSVYFDYLLTDKPIIFALIMKNIFQKIESFIIIITK